MTNCQPKSNVGAAAKLASARRPRQWSGKDAIRALAWMPLAAVAWLSMQDTRRNEAAASVRNLAAMLAQQLDLSAEDVLATALKAERKRVKNKA